MRGAKAAACLAAALSAGAAWARPPRFGHLPYDEAPAEDLADAGAYRKTGRTVKLRRAAAEAFLKMAEAARAEGVGLVPVSGFRALAYQKGLFENAVKKRGSPRAASRWVAPPGHSEHHTGLALDIGDETAPEMDVEPAFENTPAGKWLRKNAAVHGFELSFPKDNPQGVGHEPWHWRYVGNDEARRLFHGAAP